MFAYFIGILLIAQIQLREGRIRVALLAGNHDPLGEGSVWTRARFESTCDNVTFFGSEPQVVVFQDLDLTVIGQSVGPDRPQTLSPWPRDRATRFAVGVAHGSAYREGGGGGGGGPPAGNRPPGP